ncbi:ROK family protein [Candidatus Parcubacteria bacterium]|nr:ROK family protein [Patescibacteria group bacterium]MBU4309547.1 ROK family protein [Patescibacteria group bacterium]MBU4432173.1 ROK family protein [Patescibacteria group bacterium]MBU4578065.1 ROK family protein [Patescibacteria group bacterium]MCG2696427.1 ROK family protein [Candidatus Parcubacteria bacterium]
MSNDYTIGVDIGGTNMKAVLFDGKKVVSRLSLATPKDSLDHLLIMIKALIEPLEEEAKKDRCKIVGIGLSVAGLVDFDEQKIVQAPNVDILNNVKLAQIVQEKTGYRSVMDNDGKCFVRAEVLLGAAKKHTNVFGVALGTSVGSSWWVNGDIYRGHRNGAGEICSMIVNFSEKISLEDAYMKLLQASPAKLSDQAYHGDDFAIKSYEEVGQILGIALANVVNTIDPEVFVVGGGVMESSPLFLPELKKTMREFVGNPEAKKIDILKSKLGSEAGAIGAALLLQI